MINTILEFDRTNCRESLDYIMYQLSTMSSFQCDDSWEYGRQLVAQLCDGSLDTIRSFISSALDWLRSSQ